MIAHYLRLAVWPRGLVVDYGWPVPLIVGDVARRLFVLGLLVALHCSRRCPWPRGGFLGVWILATLAPTRALCRSRPRSARNGACISRSWPRSCSPSSDDHHVAACGREPTRQPGRSPPTCDGGPRGHNNCHRARDCHGRTGREYQSPLALAQVTLDRWPSSVAHATFGSELAANGRRDEALAQLRAAVAGGDFRARYPLGAGAVRPWVVGRGDHVLTRVRGRRQRARGARYEGAPAARERVRAAPELAGRGGAVQARARAPAGRRADRNGFWPTHCSRSTRTRTRRRHTGRLCSCSRTTSMRGPISGLHSPRREHTARQPPRSVARLRPIPAQPRAAREPRADAASAA